MSLYGIGFSKLHSSLVIFLCSPPISLVIHHLFSSSAIFPRLSPFLLALRHFTLFPAISPCPPSFPLVLRHFPSSFAIFSRPPPFFFILPSLPTLLVPAFKDVFKNRFSFTDFLLLKLHSKHFKSVTSFSNHLKHFCFSQ